MRAGADLLDEAQLQRLSGTRFDRVLQLQETTSTNSVCIDAAGDGAAEGLVVVADFQSGGRGRFDRKWEAPPGKALLFSVLLRPSSSDLPPGRRHLAVSAVSLALLRGARSAAGVTLELKWPNDLMCADRKIAGVLAEAAAGDAIVVGAGLNVSWAPPGAASLEELAAGRLVQRGDLLVETLLALDERYGNWDDIAVNYRASCMTIGRTVTVTGTGGAPDVAGTAVDVDADGRLGVLVAGDGGGAGALIRVAAGDVTHAAVTPGSGPGAP